MFNMFSVLELVGDTIFPVHKYFRSIREAEEYATKAILSGKMDSQFVVMKPVHTVSLNKEKIEFLFTAANEEG